MFEYKHTMTPEVREKTETELVDMMKKMDDETYYAFLEEAGDIAWIMVGGYGAKKNAESRDDADAEPDLTRRLQRFLKIMNEDAMDAWFVFATEAAQYGLAEQEVRVNG